MVSNWSFMTGNEKVYKSEFSIVCFVMFSLVQMGHGWNLLVRMKIPCLGSGVSPLEFVLSFFFFLFFFAFFFFFFFIAAMHIEAQFHSFFYGNKNSYFPGYTVN